MGAESAADSCLLVDMGNQRLKWRLWSVAGGTRREGSLALDDAGSASTTSSDARFDAAFNGVTPPARVLLSAVSRGGVVAAFRRWCRERWNVTAEAVESPPAYGALVNGYDNPAQLGCDRWLAALAAHEIARADDGSGDVIVVDAGTAVTVDLVQDDRFVGGAILPGFATMIRVLGRDTGRIRLDPAWFANEAKRMVMPGASVSAAATSSNAAVHAGAFHAVCGGVERCIDNLRERAGQSARLLLTGGDAEMVAAGIRQSGETRRNLVLDGLALMARGDAAPDVDPRDVDPREGAR